MNTESLRVGAHTIGLSHPDKVLFPGKPALTKRDLIEYYRRIAQTMLPHLKARPLVMQRFPDGIEGEGFFEKDISEYFPKWIGRVTVPKVGGTVTHVVCENAATLVYLAAQACITLHVWLSRVDELHHPDRLILDLDPPGDDFGAARTAAHRVARLLDDLGLATFVMTTGSRGLHVVAPLDRRADFDAVRAFCRSAAALLVHRYPHDLTVEARIAERAGRLFLDTARNAYAQTAVAPYTVRAKPGAPVATPLAWDELDEPALNARTYRVGNIFERLEHRGDPWKGMARHAQSLTQAAKTLAARGPCRAAAAPVAGPTPPGLRLRTPRGSLAPAQANVVRDRSSHSFGLTPAMGILTDYFIATPEGLAGLDLRRSPVGRLRGIQAKSADIVKLGTLQRMLADQGGRLPVRWTPPTASSAHRPQKGRGSSRSRPRWSMPSRTCPRQRSPPWQRVGLRPTNGAATVGLPRG